MKDLSKIKLIISDFDQTLTDNHHMIADENIDSIKRFIAIGGKFGIATGRALPLIFDRINDFKLGAYTFPLITYQGAITADSKGTIHEHKFMPYEDVLTIVKYLEDNHIHFHISTLNEVLAILSLKNIDFFNGIKTFIQVANFKSSIYKYLLDHKDTEVVQISILAPLGNTDDIKEDLNTKFSGKVLFVKSHPLIIETTAISTSKGNAVESLGKSLGLDADEIMVIGDSLNDLSMFEKPFVKVAVENAEPLLKEKADYISSSNVDCGVSKIIKQVIESKKQLINN